MFTGKRVKFLLIRVYDAEIFYRSNHKLCNGVKDKLEKDDEILKF